MTDSQTVSVSIHRNPDEVYDFLADPANFPKWSLFIRELRQDGDEWLANTPDGTVRIRFTPRNAFRVVDHDVITPSDLKVHVPVRVLPNQDDGSEVIFTVFCLPGMTDAQFANDVKMVLTDLAGLKRVLETGADK